MIFSMTGFGSASIEGELGIFTIEIKTINNRFLDYNIRIPGRLANLENNIRKEAAKYLRRGRADIVIRWAQGDKGMPSVRLNLAALEKIHADLKGFEEKLGLGSSLKVADLLHIPSLYFEMPLEIDEKLVWKELKKPLKKALTQCRKSRRDEGNRLSAELLDHVTEMEEHRAKVDEGKSLVLDRYRERLMKKIEDFNESAQTPIDMQRLESEVLFFADKADIAEELARLQSHFTAFREFIESDGSEPVGRSMEFLCQEMLREVNTIGSKARETTVCNLVISMKNVVEKLREQVQNIE